MTKKEIGQLGEQYAEKFLLEENLSIITKNYYTRVGELDIVAFDKAENQYVIVEVKTRTSRRFGLPQEGISLKKYQKIIMAALHFLAKTPKHHSTSWRIDCIAVELTGTYSLKKITHFKSIYGR